MTGRRIGYAAASEEVVRLMSNIQSHTTSNPNSIAQYASGAALKGDASSMDAMVVEFKNRRDYMVNKVNTIYSLSCIKPQGAFYVMINISKIFGKKSNSIEIKDSIGFSDELLEKEKVAVIPGIGFGMDDYIRLLYATSMDNIKRGLDRIEKFVKELK